MSSRFRTNVWVLLAIVLTAPVLAQQSPLSQVPAKSPIVIQIRGWERTLERIKVSLKAAAPDHADMVAGKVEEGLAQLLMVRELKALDKNGPVFLVFTEVPDADSEIPHMAVVARVTNYVQFRDALLKDDEKKALKANQGYETTKIGETEVHFVDREGFAIVAFSDKALKEFLDKKADSLATRLDKMLSNKLLDADVSVYVDIKAVYKQFGDQIDSFKAAIEQVIEQTQMGGLLDKDQLQLVKRLYEGLFRLVEDCEGAVVSLDFRPEGFMVRLHTQVGEKSKTNELLRTFKPSPLEGLAKLPIGQMSYVSGAADLEWMKNLTSLMTTGAVGGGGANADNKSVADALKALTDLKANGWAASADVPAAGVHVNQYDDAVKVAEATLKFYQSLPENASLGAVIKSKPEIKANAEKLNGHSFHSVKITWDIEKTVERLPEELRELYKGTLKHSLGDGMNMWFGSDGKTVVQATAKDWAAAKKMLEEYFQGKEVLSGNASYQATRKELPAEANLLMFMDAARYGHYIAKTIGEMMKNLPGAPGGGGDVKAPEGKPSYIGLAVVLQPRHGALDIWVPVDAVKIFIKIFVPLFGGLDG
jgi:hypothetical protein